MFAHLPNALDPGLAALIGALVGAGSAVVVQVIAAIITAQHNTRSYRRTLRKEIIASVADAYEHALNVFVNIKSGATPDKSTFGKVFAQISLRGSPAVNKLLNEFQMLSVSEKSNLDINPIINAMQEHLAKLERESR